MDKFCERLKELRTDKHFSLAQLSKQTGFSQGALSYWENGQRIPSAEVIIILAKFFGVTSDYLLGLED